MAVQGQFILLDTGDIPGLRHQLAVLAHRQSGAGFAITGELGFQKARAQLQYGLELVDGCLGAIELQQPFAQPVIDPDRYIGGGVHATGNPALDLPQGNLVGHQ